MQPVKHWDKTKQNRPLAGASLVLRPLSVAGAAGSKARTCYIEMIPNIPSLVNLKPLTDPGPILDQSDSASARG